MTNLKRSILYGAIAGIAYIPLVAGADFLMDMPKKEFLDILGDGISAGAFIGLGYYFGRKSKGLEEKLNNEQEEGKK